MKIIYLLPDLVEILIRIDDVISDPETFVARGLYLQNIFNLLSWETISKHHTFDLGLLFAVDNQNARYAFVPVS